jgi:hypothetical protein
MFSIRQITATSNWSRAAQTGMNVYSLYQAGDAGVPALQAVQKELK